MNGERDAQKQQQRQLAKSGGNKPLLITSRMSNNTKVLIKVSRWYAREAQNENLVQVVPKPQP